MALVVIGPVFLGAVHGDTAVGASELDVLRGICSSVLGVWTVSGALDHGGTFTHGRGRGFVHGVEEVVWLEEDAGAIGVLVGWVVAG